MGEETDVCSRAARLFIPEHYFASKSFAAVRETFSNAYPNKEVSYSTTMHQLVKCFGTEDVFVCDKYSLGDC
jgi:hypothetical protein